MYQVRYGAEDHFVLAERFRALAAKAGWHPAVRAVARADARHRSQ